MKVLKFERELKTLINEVRAYGIQHSEYKNNVQDVFYGEAIRTKFIKKVHTGFALAQRRCVMLLKQVLTEKKKYKAELKDARRERDKERQRKLESQIDLVSYQEMALRKIMDSIAWQIFNQDLSTIRRLYYGQELIDITDSNLESDVVFAEEYMQKYSESFVLISDLTTFIQIGDVVILEPNKGITLCELKDGEINKRVFELLRDFSQVNCPHYVSQKLQEETDKFQEQFWRDVKQIKRNHQVLNLLNSGEGKDLYSGLDVTIRDREIVMDSYVHIVRKLLDESGKKGHAKFIVEECLFVGVYEPNRFPDKAFDIWVKCLNIKMPIIDFRQSMFDPTAYPIYLHSFSESQIMDIISGKKVVKFTLDIETWLKMFERDGLKYRWLNKRETARINSKFKGNLGIFSLEGCGVEICDEEGFSQYIAEGVFSRMFSNLETPRSIERFLYAIYEETK